MNLSAYVTGFIAVFFYALLPTMAKKLQVNIPTFAFMAITQAFLSMMALAALMVTERDFSFAKISAGTWLGLLLFSVVNIFGFSLYLKTIARIPVTEYQLITLIGPIFGALAAYVLLDEQLKLRHCIGAVIMSFGLYVAVKGWGSDI